MRGDSICQIPMTGLFDSKQKRKKRGSPSNISRLLNTKLSNRKLYFPIETPDHYRAHALCPGHQAAAVRNHFPQSKVWMSVCDIHADCSGWLNARRNPAMPHRRTPRTKEDIHESSFLDWNYWTSWEPYPFNGRGGRGHKILGLARHPIDVVSQPNLTVAQSDATVPW